MSIYRKSSVLPVLTRFRRQPEVEENKGSVQQPAFNRENKRKAREEGGRGRSQEGEHKQR